MKRSLALLLAAMILASAAACGDTADTSSVQPQSSNEPADTTTAEETTTSPLDAIPTGDYGGHEFIFIYDDLSANNYSESLDAEELNGAILNDTVYERNMLVEEKLNVKISAKSSSSVQSAVTKQSMAGSYDYDAAYMQLSQNFAAALAGALYNLYNIPTVDLEAGWWDQDAVEYFTFAPGKCWFANTDLNTNILSAAGLVIFNKDMLNNYGLENPYDLVRANTWTLDKMYDMAKVVNSDANGNGKPDEGDIFGLTIGIGSYAMLLNGAGQRLVDLDENYALKYRIIEEDFLDASDKIARMFNDQEMTAILNSQSWAVGNFKAGNSLFYTDAKAGYLVGMSQDVDFMYGVLPYPLRNEQQDRYYSSYDSFASGLCLPLAQEDVERTGNVIEALSIYSYQYLTDAYYDTTLIGKCARDADTEKMLELVFAGRIFDYSLIFSNMTGNAWMSLYNSLSKKGIEDLASVYESNHVKVETAWESAMETFASL